MEKIIDVSGKLVIDLRAREWCKLPYPKHPRGCPNYDSGRDTCPPNAPLVFDKFDLNKQHWFAIVDFNLKEFKERMRLLHPCWSERQLGCCLYWQGGVRKRLREFAGNFVMENMGTEFSTCPEAMGVHVINTLKKFNIPIKKDIDDTVFKVAMIGYPFI